MNVKRQKSLRNHGLIVYASVIKMRKRKMKKHFKYICYSCLLKRYPDTDLDEVGTIAIKGTDCPECKAKVVVLWHAQGFEKLGKVKSLPENSSSLIYYRLFLCLSNTSLAFSACPIFSRSSTTLHLTLAHPSIN